MDLILYNALLSYFKAVNIHVSPSELKLQLFSHPYTPSLLAVSETLDFLKIDNVAAEVEHEKLEYLPDDFIAFLENDGKKGHFAHVKKRNNRIQLHDRKTEISLEDFYKTWNGIILIAEKADENATKTPFNQGIVIFVLISILFTFFWAKPLILFFGFLGIFGLILSEEIFKTSNEVDSYLAGKICGKEEGKGCSAILNDAKYRLLYFSFNDLLFSFFTSTLIYTLWTAVFDIIHVLLYAVGILVVLVTIIIQKFVAKSWCPLCLFSSLCIVLQSVLVFTGNFYFKTVLFYDTTGSFFTNALFFILLYVLSLLLVSQHRILRESNYKMATDIIDLLRFKRSPQMVSQVISSAKKISSFNDFNPLEHENKNVDHVIRIVISTSCNFCKDFFNQFHKHYQKNKNSYSYQIVFNHFEEKSSKRNQVAASLIQIHRNKGFDALLRGLDSWFNQPTSVTFLEKYPWKKEDENVYTLYQHREWCKRNELFHTPILIIDKVIIPEHYDTSFIDDLLGQM